MGSVWVAEHIELGTRVAVKLMAPGLATTPDGLARFKREAQAVANLASVNIVQVFDYGIDADTPYIAMELLKGESLANRLTRLGRIDAGTIASIYVQVGKAVTKAHESGLVHRDLKPDNIFLVTDEDGDVAKIIDFGIAKRTSIVPGQLSALQTQTGAMLGTPYYMSPEQASGSKSIDHRTDIWSLGIIAFECITGSRPYVADSLGALVLAICTGEAPVPSRAARVPPGFDEWFARCAARTPADRFQSAKEATTALWNVCVNTGVLSPLERVREAPAVSNVASASALAASPQTDGGTPNHRAALTNAGALTLTIPGVKRLPSKRRIAILVGFACLVLVGALAAVSSWQPIGTTMKLDPEHSSASGTVATQSQPALTTNTETSAAASSVALEPIVERVSTPAAIQPPVALPRAAKAMSAKKTAERPMASVAAAPVTSAPVVKLAEKPAAPAITATPKPANPFGTRQ
jgi:serine/threonine-protein kinase